MLGEGSSLSASGQGGIAKLEPEAFLPEARSGHARSPHSAGVCWRSVLGPVSGSPGPLQGQGFAGAAGTEHLVIVTAVMHYSKGTQSKTRGET